ncbi:hypothetical protein GCM10010199_33340 [Dactylosporangium roseum]
MTYPPEANQQPPDPSGSGYGQQPYPQQPGSPPHQPPTGGDQDTNAIKWFLVIGGALVTALILCASLYFGIQKLTADSPTDVVNEFIEAARDGERTKALDLICASERAKATERDDFILNDHDRQSLIEWKVTSETAGEQTAEVRTFVSVRDDGNVESATVIITLVKEDDEWKICNLRTDR